MLTLEQARPADWSAALELAFAGQPEVDRQRFAVNALALLAGGALDPQGIWIARAASEIVGVQVCEPLGGASCLFWTPAARPDFRATAVPARLVQSGLAWSQRRGCKLAQALLLPAEGGQAGPLLQAGFEQVTELLALRHDLRDFSGRDAAASMLRYESFRAADRGLFEQTLLRTYAGTLDCPELNGRRTVAEILAGHRAAGRDRPELWWLAFEAERPIGVLLLTELPHGLDWELSYVGVVPAARGRGLGRALTQHALAVASGADALHMLAAVDSRNEPARRLYRALGFSLVETRTVYLYYFAPTAEMRPQQEREEGDFKAAGA